MLSVTPRQQVLGTSEEVAWQEPGDVVQQAVLSKSLIVPVTEFTAQQSSYKILKPCRDMVWWYVSVVDIDLVS